MTEGRLRAAIAVLALAGAGIAAYLTYTRYSGARIACATGGCETVQESSYAKLGGIPVAVLGLAAYTALFVSALSASRLAAAAGAAIALGGVVFSAYLLVVQVAVIDAICQWCLASDVTMVLLAVATVLRLRIAASGPGAESPQPGSASAPMALPPSAAETHGE